MHLCFSNHTGDLLLIYPALVQTDIEIYFDCMTYVAAFCACALTYNVVSTFSLDWYLDLNFGPSKLHESVLQC